MKEHEFNVLIDNYGHAKTLSKKVEARAALMDAFRHAVHGGSRDAQRHQEIRELVCAETGISTEQFDAQIMDGVAMAIAAMSEIKGEENGC